MSLAGTINGREMCHVYFSSSLKEAAPAKKPLTNVKSTPCVKSDENGEENVPPALTEDVAETDSSHDLDVKEKELTEQVRMITD